MSKGKEYLRIILNILIPMAITALLFWLVPKAISFFLPFVLGWLIALIANPMVRFLEKKLRIKRKHGSAIIIVLVLALLVLILYLILSKFASEITGLIQAVPSIYSGAKSDYQSLGDSLNHFYEKLPDQYQATLDFIMKNLSEYTKTFIKSIGKPTAQAASNFAHSIPSVLIGTIVMFLAAYFFVADRETILKWYKEKVPEKWQRGVGGALSDLKSVVGGYFVAQLKIMVVVYFILVIGLALLKVDFVLLVALGIAFLDMLPFFGTGTVLGPWAIIKFILGDYKFAVCLVILYLVTQLVRQVIQPKVLGDSIGMNPLAALFCMFLGYKVAGVLGMIFAVPVAMILLDLYRTGIYSNMVHSLKLLEDKINEFRRYEK